MDKEKINMNYTCKKMASIGITFPGFEKQENNAYSLVGDAKKERSKLTLSGQ